MFLFFFHFTCTDLTQPVVVAFTVGVVPGSVLVPAVDLHFGAGFCVVVVVWFSLLPVLKVYLCNNKRKTTTLYIILHRSDGIVVIEQSG